jgi:hypothetical protein
LVTVAVYVAWFRIKAPQAHGQRQSDCPRIANKPVT